MFADVKSIFISVVGMKRHHRYKEIQLPQLRGFCLAATEGNFTSAARALGLSASTVWEQVRALERQLGARLMRRRGRSIELTKEGKLLLELIQPHVTGLDSLSRLFEARRLELTQELVVASGAYLFAHVLPGPIQQYRAECPAIQLTLRIAAWSSLHRIIERGDADVAVLACDADVPRSTYLESEHLFDERLQVLVPRGHPLTRLKRVTPRDLVKYPLIIPPKGGADRKVIDRLFQKHNLLDRLLPALVCGIIDVNRQYVRREVGIALMYVTGDLLEERDGLTLLDIDAETEPLPIEMAVRKGSHLPEHVERFRQIVRQSLGDPKRCPRTPS
jgi:DNA-binding transcriptional LysR family regulator